MTVNAEQMRKKEAAQQEAERHARYAQADGSMKQMNTSPAPSRPIEAAEQNVRRIASEERALVGGENASPNDNRY